MSENYEVVELPTGSLVSRKVNPRLHPEQQIEAIGESMEEFGFTRPILVDEHHTVIAGHGRLQSARRRKMPTVPCVIAAGWSEEEKKAYMIADNRLAELSEWDQAALESELKSLDGLSKWFPDVGGDLESELTQKKDKNPSKAVGSSPIYLRAGKLKIEITREEEQKLAALLHHYNFKYSLKNGFWKWLLKGATGA